VSPDLLASREGLCCMELLTLILLGIILNTEVGCVTVRGFLNIISGGLCM
jgi:hypothetical protein